MDLRTLASRSAEVRAYLYRHRYRLSCAALLLLLLGQLSFDITGDWRHLHDDDGMHYSVIAFSHLMGPRETAFHNAYRDPLNGEIVGRYLHHPPLLGLTIALAFEAIGVTSYWVPRAVSIFFHLVVLACTAWLAWQILERRGLGRQRDQRRRRRAMLLVLAGFALIPVSTYFGKAVVYPPITMAFSMVGMVLHYRALERVRLRQRGWWLPALAALPAWTLAAFSGWFSHFMLAAAAVLALSVAAQVQGPLRRRALTLAFGCVASSAAGLAAVALHMYVAGGLEAFGDFLSVYRARSGLEELQVMGRDYTVYAAKAVALSLVRFLALVPALLTLIWAAQALRRATRKELGTADVWILTLLAPGVIYLVAANRGATQHPFYLYFIMPAVVLATAKVVLEAMEYERWLTPERRKWARIGAGVALGASILTAGLVLHQEYSVDDPFALDRVATLQILYTAPPGQRMFPPRVIRARLPAFEASPPSGLIPSSWGIAPEKEIARQVAVRQVGS